MHITISRDKTPWVDRARAYSVLIDGAAHGKIAHGETRVIDAPGDVHRVQFAIDWCKSQEVRVVGTDARVRCWANAKPWSALFWITIKSNEYIGIAVEPAND